MSRHERSMWMARARTVAGLASAVVPFAILVHLAAEGLSLGGETFGPAFVLRHLYLGVALFAAAFVFCRTVGAGSSSAERRRRCALIAAHIRGPAAGLDLASLVSANLAFFALSQLIEGVPIASGDWCLGLASAAIGSLAAALVVFVFGRSLAVAALGAIGVVLRRPQAAAARQRFVHSIPTRRASAAFSLFVPNRPPPGTFL